MDSGFVNFMNSVDDELMSIAGITHRDIPDFDYYISYEFGENPHNVAIDALQEGCISFNDEYDDYAWDNEDNDVVYDFDRDDWRNPYNFFLDL